MDNSVVLVPGDGIGPEITSAAVKAIEATGAQIDWQIVEAGVKVMEQYGRPLPPKFFPMARDCGIVSQLCDPDELMDQAMAMARKLAAKPRDALRATKRLMRRPKEPLQQRILAEFELFSQALDSPAAKEAMTAFLEE